ncbi:40S ribosomal protein S3a [Cavenderia fasciculata]|uniref:Small ribosomal subunit protein eS1 n=1 Tax=Cavenderia fasciculata TaxID=261658 RepID=F4Q8I0_CACFS|nr:40S ribosomal protein S3a [Cavenderia fasciculata]EGG16080.1 40S ribosomal protein S3a [Cavenderia fasciculata]|eukprot:XP_004352405.1 40S ribosomal protein S3a [Cavenderia fasciculata]
MSDKKKKGSKKGGKKIDPFTRKEWYSVRAPTVFFPPAAANSIGYTPVNKTMGTKLASDGLKGRVFEVSLADMKGEESQVHRKIKLRADEVDGKTVLTSFYGMDLTTDKARSLVHKWVTMIEVYVDVKTTDGYSLRVFAVTFTKRADFQVTKTSYAKTSKVKNIRKKMHEIISASIATSDINQVTKKFLEQTISAQIQSECSTIYPLTNTFIRKVKVLKTPKVDGRRLMEQYAASNSYAAPAAAAPVATAPATEETGIPVETA